MSSSAGSTRKAKNLASVIIGFLLSALAIALSFWASYYSSPRMLAEKFFTVDVESSANVTLPLPQATGEKLYYSINASSSQPSSFALVVESGGAVKEMYLGEGLRIQREGYLLLETAPRSVQLIIRCARCFATGTLSVRDFSLDYSYLLALDVAAILSSIAGLALLAVGSYGYLAQRQVEKSGRR